MAIGDAYATVEDYKAVKDLTTVRDPDALGELLTAISRTLDRRLGRASGFNIDAAATVRIYMPRVRNSRPRRDDWAESENPWLYGGMTRLLDVEDIGGAVTSITIDEARDNTYSTTLATTDYELLPRNAAVGPEARPYRQIRMTEWGDYGGWPTGARVKVTAIHGWPAVPAAIKRAVIELAAIIQGDGFMSTNRISDLGEIIDATPQARRILMEMKDMYAHPEAVSL